MAACRTGERQAASLTGSSALSGHYELLRRWRASRFFVYAAGKFRRGSASEIYDDYTFITNGRLVVAEWVWIGSSSGPATSADASAL